MQGLICSPRCSGKKLVPQAAPTPSQNVVCKVQSSLSIHRGNLGAGSFFSNYVVLCQEEGLCWKGDRNFPAGFDAWFSAHLGCRSLLTGFWISHEGNWYVYYWVGVSLRGRKTRGFLFCHLADATPIKCLLKWNWLLFSEWSWKIKYFGDILHGTGFILSFDFYSFFLKIDLRERESEHAHMGWGRSRGEESQAESPLTRGSNVGLDLRTH